MSLTRRHWRFRGGGGGAGEASGTRFPSSISLILKQFSEKKWPNHMELALPWIRHVLVFYCSFLKRTFKAGRMITKKYDPGCDKRNLDISCAFQVQNEAWNMTFYVRSCAKNDTAVTKRHLISVSKSKGKVYLRFGVHAPYMTV